MTRVLPETPNLRWFEAYPPCRMCGKPAAGVLRDVRNESYGSHCKRCADKRLKLSAKVNAELKAERGITDPPAGWAPVPLVRSA